MDVPGGNTHRHELAALSGQLGQNTVADGRFVKCQSWITNFLSTLLRLSAGHGFLGYAFYRLMEVLVGQNLPNDLNDLLHPSSCWVGAEQALC